MATEDDKRITKAEYRTALWSAHMDRLRANLAFCREPGEAVPSPSEYLEPCEAGDSFAEELRKLISAGKMAYHEAGLRAQKRVEAWDAEQDARKRSSGG
jgi:hypothetical protein